MNYCRFCTTGKIKAEESYKIFKKHDIGDGVQKSIKELISVFKDIALEIHDELPKVSCKNCLQKLISAYNFYMQIKSRSEFTTIEQPIKTGRLVPILPKPIDKEEKKYFRCIKCQQKFDDNLKLNEHYKKDHAQKKRIYKCCECDAEYRSYEHLKEHRNKHLNEGFCLFCNTGMFTDESLKLHMETDHGNSKFKCRICKTKTFTTKFLFRNHLKAIHKLDANTYFCNNCHEQFLDKTVLQKHFTSCHPVQAQEQMYSYSQDDDLSMDEEFLDEILLNQDENELAFAEYCLDNLSINFDELLSGANQMTDQSVNSSFVNYKCPMCSNEFEKQIQMNLHLAEDHRQYVLCCNTCGEKFNNIDHLRKHKFIHRTAVGKNKELTCKICSKTFKTKQGLQYHSFLHKSDLEFACLYCAKLFTSAVNLGAHVRSMHSIVKKHVCSLCDSKFSTLDHLKKHVLSFHQRERNFLCFQCGKAYSQSCHLKKHFETTHVNQAIKKKEKKSKKKNKIILKT